MKREAHEMSQGKKAPLATRFWEHVAKGEPDACWLWRGGVNNCGYGAVCDNGRMRTAHRVSYELHGGPIPLGARVLHRCDTPRCVNPSHLFLGTQRENVLDAIGKGRLYTLPPGGKRGRGRPGLNMGRRTARTAIE